MNMLAILPAILAASLTSCATYNTAPDGQSFVSSTASQSNNSRVASPIISSSIAELSDEEKELYHFIMKYRKDNGLPEIPMSKSLSLVAKLHVRDLEQNAVPAPYNFHSWSKNGPWQSVNYTPDHRYAKLMWNKPRELTKYKGNGFEIVYMNSGSATSRDAFSIWKASKLHNAVITNDQDWKRMQWKAIGLGIHGRYAAVWFGDENDPDT